MSAHSERLTNCLAAAAKARRMYESIDELRRLRAWSLQKFGQAPPAPPNEDEVYAHAKAMESEMLALAIGGAEASGRPQ